MQKQEEQWKDVIGYEGYYQVSSFGRVKSLYTNKIMKDTCRGEFFPYNVVCLSKNGIRTKKTVHILVAQAFIPNPDNKPEVDHIDRNTKNNHVENLRWVTKSENCLNRDNVFLSHNFDGKRPTVTVRCYDPEQNTEKFFNSISDAVSFLKPKNKKDRHTKSVNISACLHGKQKTCCGYIWTYCGKSKV